MNEIIILLVCVGTMTFQWDDTKDSSTVKWQETLTLNLTKGWVNGTIGGLIQETNEALITWKPARGGYAGIDRVTGHLSSNGPSKDGYLIGPPLIDATCKRMQQQF